MNTQPFQDQIDTTATYLLIFAFVGCVIFVLFVILFFKIWFACTDIAKMRPVLEDMKQILMEAHPIIDAKGEEVENIVNEDDRGISKDSTSSHENM